MNSSPTATGRLQVPVAILFMILVLLVVTIICFKRVQKSELEGHPETGLFRRHRTQHAGFASCTCRILSMVIFSFNNSRLVTVWDAANSPTLKWYVALLSNGPILRAAWLSIRVAACAATGAVVLAQLVVLSWRRFGPFRGRTLLSAMTTAPLVMPE